MMLGMATFTLLAGLVDDMRSRKVHNQLVIALFAITALASVYFRGFDGTLTGAMAFGLAIAICIPLFTAGILGGGDVKLFAVFALAVDPATTFWTLVYSIVWGALFGLTRAALQKQLLVLVRNTYKIGQRQKVEARELHKIPYTFALLLGWFTQITLLHVGGGL